MTTVSDFASLVGSIYDAALDPRQWPSALETIARGFNAKAAALQVVDQKSGAISPLSSTYGITADWAGRLHAAHAEPCPLISALFQADIGQPAALLECVPESELRKSRFYRDWCEPQDISDMAGSVVARSLNETGYVLVMRSAAKPRFGPPERNLMATVAPHLRRALAISGLLDHKALEIENLEQIIDQLQVAIIIVENQGQIRKSNAAADRLLASQTVVTYNEGRLSFLDRTVERQILEHLASPSRQPIVVPCAPEPAPSDQKSGSKARIAAAVLPLRNKKSATSAILFHVPDETLSGAVWPLVHAFGFTPREMAVAIPLMEGRSVTEIAESLGISVATTRTHVQNMLDKTGTTRQADLIRVIIQAIPPVRLF